MHRPEGWTHTHLSVTASVSPALLTYVCRCVQVKVMHGKIHIFEVTWLQQMLRNGMEIHHVKLDIQNFSFHVINCYNIENKNIFSNLSFLEANIRIFGKASILV